MSVLDPSSSMILTLSSPFLTSVMLWVHEISGMGNPEASHVRVILSWMLVTFTATGKTRIIGATVNRDRPVDGKCASNLWKQSYH